jgi:hypothetical protein
METKNFLNDWAQPDDWWFWVLFPITIPLWLLGALIDLF